MPQETQAWNIVADCVEAYLSNEQSEEGLVSFDSYLPPNHGPSRNLAIIELAKIEMEQYALLGIRPTVDEYMTRYPELIECTGGVPLDLILEEMRLRMSSESYVASDYQTRYPQHASAIKRYSGYSWLATISTSRSMKEVHGLFRVGDCYEDFQILNLLGMGGFAKVYLARQTTMQRMVALKVSADSGDEAKTLAQLDHPNIVRVFDVRTVSVPKLRLLSMQYVPGGTLAEVIAMAKDEPFSSLSGKLILQVVDKALLSAGLPAPEESLNRTKLAQSDWFEAVCEIGIQLADALDYAHHQKVLHRDVKPANVLLTAEGICKLADFNISYSEDIVGTNPATYFGGSLIYMSPEQLQVASWSGEVQAEQLDGRSDVFSLAAVLWELLTTERPWPNDPLKMDWGATVAELHRRRLQDPPAVPEGMEQSQSRRRLMHCLREALNPIREMRTNSPAALAGQLRLCRSPEAWSVLHPEESRWSRLACNYPTLLALVAVFLPNGLAGAFNYHYNLAWFTKTHPSGHKDLIDVSILLNIVSFGMGGVFFFYIVWPVSREVYRRMHGDRRLDSAYIQRAILTGHTVAVFGLALWLTAGVLFPTFLSMRMQAFSYQDSVHFFMSLAVCGAIAVSYPFLGMSLIAVKIWYGVLIGSDLRDPIFRERGKALLRWCDLYLLTATAVPLAGLGMLLGLTAPVRSALGFLVAISALGLFLAFRVHHRIHDSIEKLAPVLDP